MFNEILNGKATNEPPRPAGQGPYRVESIPQISLTCSDCGTSYTANVGTAPGRCGPCNVAFVARNQAISNAALHESLAGIESRRRQARILRWGLITLAAVALAFLKVEFRKSMQQDQAAEPPYSYDPYAEQARSYAAEMCGCTDAACGSTVRAKFINWQRNAVAPGDEAVESANRASNELFACYEKLTTR